MSRIRWGIGFMYTYDSIKHWLVWGKGNLFRRWNFRQSSISCNFYFWKGVYSHDLANYLTSIQESQTKHNQPEATLTPEQINALQFYNYWGPIVLVRKADLWLWRCTLATATSSRHYTTKFDSSCCKLQLTLVEFSYTWCLNTDFASRLSISTASSKSGASYSRGLSFCS